MKQMFFSLVLLLNSALLFAQANPVLNEVLYDPVGANAGNQLIEIKNIGDATADIGGWWFCNRLSYTQLPTGVTIPPGGIIVFHVGSSGTNTSTDIFLSGMSSLNASASDVSFYFNSTFTSSSSIRDFVQWGSGGNGRESVAVGAGIWTAGDFITDVTEGHSIEYDGDGNSSSDWVDQPVPTIGQENTGVPPAPSISIQPNSLDYGDVILGFSSDLNITITNVGDTTLIVSDINSSSAVFTTLSDTSFSLQPDSSILVNITFTPDSVGLFSGTLTIFNNDPVDSTASVSLAGTAFIPLPATIAVSPDSLLFGDVFYESSSDLNLTVSNIGDSTLIVSDINFSSAAFATLSDTSFSLQPDIAMLVNVTFTPDSVGLFTGTLTIFSNDSLNPETILVFTGSGVTGAHDVEPLSLIFGGVEVGDSTRDTVYVRNVGTVDLPITVTPPGSDEFNALGRFELVPPNDVLTVPVLFTPSALAEFTDILIVSSPAGVDTVTLTGNGITVGVDEKKISPRDFILFQNYPNPFNPETIIQYTLPNEYEVTLTIFDLSGKEILLLNEGRKSAGYHTFRWNASNRASGIYFYRLQASLTSVFRAGELVQTKKMLLLK